MNGNDTHATDEIFDLYELIHTVRALNPARAARQRELLQLAEELPSLELIEDARFLMKLAAVRAEEEATAAQAEVEHFRGRLQRQLAGERVAPPRSHHRKRGRPRKERKEREKPELLPEVAALRLYRLEKNLPYRVLGEEVGRAVGKPVRMETLRNVITGAHAPHPQTLALIRTFLRSVEQAPPVDTPVDGDEATH